MDTGEDGKHGVVAAFLVILEQKQEHVIAMTHHRKIKDRYALGRLCLVETVQ